MKFARKVILVGYGLKRFTLSLPRFIHACRHMVYKSSQRPKWASKLHNLKNKAVVFTHAKSNPIPSERDILVFCWELWEPLLIEFIERNFIPKKK